jgi:hypothetical protein
MRHKRVRISECSGTESGKVGVLVPWNYSPETCAISNEYPFCGGRTPQGMGWVAIKLDDGTFTTMPKKRVFDV